MMIQTALLVAVLAAGQAPPEGIEPRGDLVFCSKRDGDFEIYRMDLPSRGLLALTHNGSQDLDPCWTAEGKEILFVSNRDGRYALYVMDADGRAQELLHRESGAIRRPASSPDGTWIAFTVFDQGEPEPGEGKVPPFGRVRVFNRATRRSYAVSPAGWSADDASFDSRSRTIYFSAVDKGPMLVKVSLTHSGIQGKPEVLYRSPRAMASPRGAPSGDGLYFVLDGKAHSLGPKGAQPSYAALSGKVRQFSISPAGPAVFAALSEGQYDLWLMRTPSGKAEKLAANSADDLAPSLK